MILDELLRLEPLLKEYIYLFRFSSKEKEMMRRVAALADALVVWGGDKTVRSVRLIALPNQKIIEWGHKISFAYITADGMNEAELVKLAEHIIKTRQKLCSSCQGIYYNSDSREELISFCKLFSRVLEQTGMRMQECDIGWIANNTVLRYTYVLEHLKEKVELFESTGANLFYLENSELEVSLQEGNLWVKSMLEKEMIRTLKKHHGHLQTVGLLCGEGEEKSLKERFIKAGVTRISSVGDMSAVFPGDAHDGEYPLRRYVKIVDL